GESRLVRARAEELHRERSMTSRTRVPLWAGLALAVTASLAAQTPAPRTAKPAATLISPVRMYAIAERADGTIITDLKQDEISVIVDGKPQAVIAFSPTSGPVSVVALIDTSASVGMTGIGSVTAIQRGLEQWIPLGLKPGDHARYGTISKTLALTD